MALFPCFLGVEVSHPISLLFPIAAPLVVNPLPWIGTVPFLRLGKLELWSPSSLFILAREHLLSVESPGGHIREQPKSLDWCSTQATVKRRKNLGPKGVCRPLAQVGRVSE